MVAPQVRLELTTLRLTAECSAIELLRIILLCLLPSSLPRRLLAPAALPLLLSLPCAPRLRRSRSLRARALPLPPHGAGAGKTSVSPAPLPGSRQRPTLPSRSQLSTISVWRLNFCVRYGYRWFPPAIVTGNFLSLPFASAPLQTLPPPAPSKLHSYSVDQQTYTLLLFRSSPRPISIAKLHTLPRFHRRPIYLIVFEGSYLF